MSQPQSIWGGIDLRSAAKSVEEDGLLPTEMPRVVTAEINESGLGPIGFETKSDTSAFEEPIVAGTTETLAVGEKPTEEQAPPRRKSRGKDLKPRRRRDEVGGITNVPPSPMSNISWEDELAALDAENLRLKRELSEKLRSENNALVAMLKRLS